MRTGTIFFLSLWDLRCLVPVLDTNMSPFIRNIITLNVIMKKTHCQLNYNKLFLTNLNFNIILIHKIILDSF